MSELINTPLFSSANLVSYYRLEDVSDSKGSNTLTNNNTVTFASAKFANGADQGASNTNKYLSNATNLGIAGNGAMTVAFWIKLQTEIGSGTQTVFHHGSNTTADRYFELNYAYNGGTRQLSLSAAGGAVTYNIALGTTNFYHIAAGRDTTDAYLWVNGTQVGTVALGSGTEGGNRFVLGAATGGGNPTSAIFDDCAVFNALLTQAQVTSLYNSGGGFFAVAR